MQSGAGAWIIWGMLLAGAGLALASLCQPSERFWRWKRARQLHDGEVVAAATALRAGQAVHLALISEKKSPSRLSSSSSVEKQAAARTNPDESPLLPKNERPGEGLYPPMDDRERFQGRVVSLSHNLLTLTLESDLPASDTTFARPKVGQTWAVEVTGAGELYRFDASVHAVQFDTEQPFCTRVTLKLPLWLARIQRRQHTRAPVQAGATLWHILPGGVSEGVSTAVSPVGAHVAAKTGANKKASGDIQVLHGTLHDLSGGGLHVELDGAYSPNALARLCDHLGDATPLDIRLDLPLLRDTPLRLRVHACQRSITRGGLSARIRGEFVDLPAWQQETLISYVFQAQRDRMRQHSPRFETMPE